MFPWTGFDSPAKRRIQRAAIVFSLAAVFVCGVCRFGFAGSGDVWQPLTEKLVQDGFDRTYVSSLFGRSSLVFSPEIMARKMNALLNTKLSAKKPGPPREPEVMERYLNPILIAGAYGFYREHREIMREIEQKYSVPGDVLTALMLVETKLGTQVGRYNALTILGSMALGGDYELIRPYIKQKNLADDTTEWLIRRTRQKGNWAYGELKSLITYAQKNGQDPLIIPSSMYGAIGYCQFIPSSALAYGRDGNGDGKVNLFEMNDALYSMAYFIKRHGWKPELDREAQLAVIYRYNHSKSYSLTIMAVADRLRKTSEFFGN
ncbi:lytic murein transglycosylase [uncultured Pseudodesulfovibrio sp.]|uniref:lytic murein transglycosylase n=1 Tax=uncultured Pseudodesulfovibrio sp. TaxID=2035858 RepID=UPI0029C9725D|nr:lytic murein transglycosylase [uncultured Pseudodesulfovibrio sp.]